MRALGIVPARRGSKGVVGKNMRDVAGQPLVSYAIRTALDSDVLTTAVVSTDDPEVASLARDYGIVVVERPPELAADDTGMAPVLQHALLAVELGADEFDVVVLLQPTAPIRRTEDVAEVVDMLAKHPECDSVVSVVRVEDAHPGRMYRCDEAGRLDPVWPEWESANRQDLPPVFLRNGALYAVRRETLMGGDVIGDRPLAYRMPSAWLANVDDERDLIVTEALMIAWREGRLA